MTLIGVDLGGTNLRAGLVRGGSLVEVLATPIDAEGPAEGVLEMLYDLLERLGASEADGIGVGVPSVVDVERGVVYDVQNIPSWTEVPLRDLLRVRFGRPVYVNNDANCFALGEYHFGQHPPCRSMIGLILGTGFAGGVVIGGTLHAGPNCGAGEFGMIPYRDSVYEYYCSGQFFNRTYGTTGKALFAQAEAGDAEALRIFDAFGRHLGQAVQTVLYAYDPEQIVFGGSVRHAYPYFRDALHEALGTFVYPRTVERLRLSVSTLDHSALLGAAALALG